MPDDLHQALIDALAAAGDENFKRLLLLMIRLETVFIERVDMLAEQMTVPAAQHADDHGWIASVRRAEGGVKTVLWKVLMSVAEKGGLVVAGVLAGKFVGG